MAKIITYKKNCYCQIKLDSGERILFSCATESIAIFRLRFFGKIPSDKIGEWRCANSEKEFMEFYNLFGNPIHFDEVVQKLTTFPNIAALNAAITNGT